jgi:hypothetical protein
MTQQVGRLAPCHTERPYCHAERSRSMTQQVGRLAPCHAERPLVMLSGPHVMLSGPHVMLSGVGAWPD